MIVGAGSAGCVLATDCPKTRRSAFCCFDAAITPTIDGGNTNAPTIMIAEKAADLIRGRADATVASA